ncbi:MAG: phosphoribosyl-ATP diphosphatase [Pseudomonadota bacterium]
MLIIDRLYETIISRKNQKDDNTKSYVVSLFTKGHKKIAQKVGEEAVELALASAYNDKKEIISETADLIFHILVLLAAHDIKLEEISDELLKREGISGIDEKANRS